MFLSLRADLRVCKLPVLSTVDQQKNEDKANCDDSVYQNQIQNQNQHTRL